jgi:RNA polymerase sigma factor (sigma-70 family)
MASAAILLHHIRRLAGAPAVDGQPDRELLRRFTRDGDGQAFAALLRRHGPMAWAACRRILPREADAEDVLQKTFLLLAQKAAGLRDPDSVGGWLYGVAYRLALRARSEAARRADREGRTPPRDPPDPLADITRRETQQLFDEALARLPEKCRAVLVLCCLEGRTQDEAARQLGCSLSTLKRRLEEGRTRLGQQLVRHGLTLPAAALAAMLAPRTNAALPPALTAAVLRAVTGVPGAGVVGRVVGGLLAGRRRLAVAALGITVALGAGGVAYWATSPHGKKPDAQEERLGPRVDGFGDPLPDGALARIGTTRFRHTSNILLIAFTEDGKRVLSYGLDAIRVWDAATGREQYHQLFKPGMGWGWGLDGRQLDRFAPFSPDGKLATMTITDDVGKRPLTLWDLTTGKKVKVLDNCFDGVPAGGRFAPGGRVLALLRGDNTTIETRDVATGEKLASWSCAEGNYRVYDRNSGFHGFLAFTGDGKTLMTVGTLETERAAQRVTVVVRFWDAASGTRLRRLDGRAENAAAGAPGDDDFAGVHLALRDFPLALSADGKLIAVARSTGDRITGVCILDTADGKELRQLSMTPMKRAQTTLVGTAEFTFLPDGKVLAGMCRFHQADTPDVSGAFHWAVATGKELACLTLPPYGRASSAFSAFSRDGKTVAVTTDQAVRLYDVASGKELPRGAGPHGPADLIGLASDGRTLVTAEKSASIVVWDTATGAQRRRLEKAAGGLLLSADGSTLVSSDDDSLRVWEVATGQQRQIQKFAGGLGRVRPLACSPDGKRIAVDARGVQVVDTTTGRSIWELGMAEPLVVQRVEQASFLPDGQSLVVCDRYCQAQVCNLTTGKAGKAIPQIEPGRNVSRGRIAFSPDGRLIAFQQEQGNMIVVHELAGGTEVCHSEELAAPDTKCLLALSPDGRTVAWGRKADSLLNPQDVGKGNAADSMVHLLDVATGKERHAFDGHSGGIVSLTFSADGKTLVSGGADTTLLVWDLTAHQAAPGSGQPERPIAPRKTPPPPPPTTERGTQRG